MYNVFFTVFASILHHFYLVDDIYDTKLTFSYQYFIIYGIQYEYPIRTRIPVISPDIRYEKPPSDMIQYPIFRTLLMRYLVNLQEDLDTIDRLITEAEAHFEKWRHPDPYIGNLIMKSQTKEISYLGFLFLYQFCRIM